jgi:hypothetical protein
MSVFRKKPRPLLQLVIHDVARSPGLTGAIAGYECSSWRNEAFADYLFEWLPEFALKYSEIRDVNSSTAIRLIRKAARTVYTTEKYGKRGEFGELLLHAMIREVFDSEPAISKIFYKSSTNETVKGFDAVHVVEDQGSLELWLGEAKFFSDCSDAISKVVKEINDHARRDYLRDEFILIASKIDPQWKHAERLRELIDGRTSLDVVFKATCVPVLLTYESNCVATHSEATAEFEEELVAELEGAYRSFAERKFPPLRIHLFLVPLSSKVAFVEILHRKLKGLQA